MRKLKKIKFKKRDNKQRFEIYGDLVNDEIDVIIGTLKWKKNKITHIKIEYSSIPRQFEEAQYCESSNKILIHCRVDPSITESDYGNPNGFGIQKCILEEYDIPIFLLEYKPKEELNRDCHPIGPPTREGNIIVGGPGFIED
ncbi:hypothetical protein [Flavicella sediminum]|uniref:hypothetical protein n=1 Tax=Flavicella sediminum TaxID=2585141 RepID=UPI00111DEE22|nr:hypothetical protein [Flavicella sediminum]